MKEILLRTLVLAYGGVAVLTVLGYLPTIRDLYYHKKMSANIPTYALWMVACTTGLLYAVVMLDDLLVQVIAGINFIANLVILVLAVQLARK